MDYKPPQFPVPSAVIHRFDSCKWFPGLCLQDQDFVHQFAAKYPERDADEAERYINRVIARRGDVLSCKQILR